MQRSSPRPDAKSSRQQLIAMIKYKMKAVSDLAHTLAPPGSQAEWLLTPSFKLGRNVSPHDGIRLPQNWVQFSQNHCKIFLEPSDTDMRWFVEDTSTNGTWVNDVRVPKHGRLQLKEGDNIRLSTPASQYLEFQFTSEILSQAEDKGDNYSVPDNEQSPVPYHAKRKASEIADVDGGPLRTVKRPSLAIMPLAGAEGNSAVSSDLKALQQMERSNADLRRRLESARRATEEAERQLKEQQAVHGEQLRAAEAKAAEAERRATGRAAVHADALAAELAAARLRADEAVMRLAAVETRLAENAAQDAARKDQVDRDLAQAKEMLADALRERAQAVEHAASVQQQVTLLQSELAGAREQLRVLHEESSKQLEGVKSRVLELQQRCTEEAAMHLKAQEEAVRLAQHLETEQKVAAANRRLAEEARRDCVDAQSQHDAERSACLLAQQEVARLQAQLREAGRRLEAADDQLQVARERLSLKNSYLRNIDTAVAGLAQLQHSLARVTADISTRLADAMREPEDNVTQTNTAGTNITTGNAQIQSRHPHQAQTPTLGAALHASSTTPLALAAGTITPTATGGGSHFSGMPYTLAFPLASPAPGLAATAAKQQLLLPSAAAAGAAAAATPVVSDGRRTPALPDDADNTAAPPGGHGLLGTQSNEHVAYRTTQQGDGRCAGAGNGPDTCQPDVTSSCSQGQSCGNQAGNGADTITAAAIATATAALPAAQDVTSPLDHDMMSHDMAADHADHTGQHHHQQQQQVHGPVLQPGSKQQEEQRHTQVQPGLNINDQDHHMVTGEDDNVTGGAGGTVPPTGDAHAVGRPAAGATAAAPHASSVTMPLGSALASHRTVADAKVDGQDQDHDMAEAAQQQQQQQGDVALAHHTDLAPGTEEQDIGPQTLAMQAAASSPQDLGHADANVMGLPDAYAAAAARHDIVGGGSEQQPNADDGGADGGGDDGGDDSGNDDDDGGGDDDGGWPASNSHSPDLDKQVRAHAKPSRSRSQSHSRSHSRSPGSGGRHAGHDQSQSLGFMQQGPASLAQSMSMQGHTNAVHNDNGQHGSAAHAAMQEEDGPDGEDNNQHQHQHQPSLEEALQLQLQGDRKQLQLLAYGSEGPASFAASPKQHPPIQAGSALQEVSLNHGSSPLQVLQQMTLPMAAGPCYSGSGCNGKSFKFELAQLPESLGYADF